MLSHQVFPRVTRDSRRCNVCGTIILDHNWYLHVVIGDKEYDIHDNDICLATLEVRNGLREPCYLTSLSVPQ